MDSGSSHLLTAEEARKLSARNEDNANINYNLTLKRLVKIIEVAAKQGRDFVDFETPSIILDGSLADPILLARQLKKKLVSMGYKVKRNEAHLNISWE